MQSPAHLRSASAAVLDPFYSANEPAPAVRSQEDAAPWQYVADDYDCFMLRRLRTAAAAAKLNISYPGVYHEPSAVAEFRREAAAGTKLQIRLSGDWQLWTAAEPFPIAQGSREFVAHLTVPTSGTVRLRVMTDLDTALLGLQDSDPTAVWDARALPGENGAGAVENADFAPTVIGDAPTGAVLPQRELALTKLSPEAAAAALPALDASAPIPEFYDAGREVLAVVEIHAPGCPSIAVGESLPEAANTAPEHFEQTVELREVSTGVWESVVPLAFRYVRAGTADAPVTAVQCRVLYTPVVYRGAFAADEELTRIWMTSAYTLRLCLHYFQIDGIKRDRLPWVGDLAISLLANAYTFAEPAPIRRTLAALGRAGIQEAHLNGITDYSLWYIICHDLYQRYFNDPAFLVREYPRLRAMLCVLGEQTGNRIFLPPGRWLFIDWVDGEKDTALQMLFYWALTAAARLAERVDDQAAKNRTLAHAEILKTKLRESAFDSGRRLFYASPSHPESGYSRHANLLAVLSGAASPEESAAIASALAADELPPVGTPYMAALEILALHRGGLSETALQKIRAIWGGMLAQGATSFWEAYDPQKTGDEKYAFYGRPFACSLCHAWSAGPAALLPIIAFNAVPQADGWSGKETLTPLYAAGSWAVTVPAGGESLVYPQEENQRP